MGRRRRNRNVVRAVAVAVTAAGVMAPLTAVAALAGAGIVSWSTPAGASTRATTVRAVETDFHIALSTTSFTPGRYTFVAVNKGQTTHSLEITGPGLHHATTPDLSPGQRAKLTVTLRKGAYDIFCPVPGHKELGMNKNVKVVPPPRAVVGPSTTSTNSASLPPGGVGG
jgi:uncharacterized cupredoxin-like copper-binding protein